MTEMIKTEVVSVNERLKRRGLEPRTQVELDEIVLGYIDQDVETYCLDCNVNKIATEPFKTDNYMHTYRKWICPECGSEQYQEIR